MNYKNKISKSIVAIFLLLFTFGGCKKSESVLGEIKIIKPDASITQNNTYGNWIKFESMDDFRKKAEEIKKIYLESANPDSILDMEEAILGYTTLRHFYNDTTDYDFPEGIDTINFMPSIILSSLLNKFGIFQIENTIYRFSKYYIFEIMDGNTSTLSVINPLYNEKSINIEGLPSNLKIVKIFDKNTKPSDAIAAGGGYNLSFTQSKDLYSKGSRYKLVATFTLLSYPFFTDFYTSSTFEKGKKSGKVWKWSIDWAQPLILSSSTNYTISNTPWSNGNYTKGTTQSADGKKIVLFDWYIFDRTNPNSIGVDVTGLHSFHSAKRDNITIIENIYY